jgi:hypothetical protein
VTLVWLPPGTSVRELARDGFSPGLLSAGLGQVPALQTYLDIGQGNRVLDPLYDSELPNAAIGCAPREAVDERAESAPAEIVPGLLTSTLLTAGVGVLAMGEASCTFSPQWLAETGARAAKKLSGTPRQHAHATFEVRDESLRQLPSLRQALHPADLLIAVARPTGDSDEPLPIGIAGRGFDGNLTSGSTRMDGYVLSTDIAPTVIDRLGLGVPPAMSGQAMRTEGGVDAAAVVELGARLEVISSRRGPVIGLSLLAWVALLGLSIAVSRGRLARPGVRLAGIAVVYLPLVLLLGAALEPGESVEVLLALLGPLLLAALTLALLGGYRALAVASALTVLAYGVDVVVGSPLTALSLVGPNPGFGVRFYGIGNELEALLAVLIVAGTGAGLSGFRPRLSPRGNALAFIAVGILGALVFAAGRFGADVGAAIVIPLAAAVAAAVVAGRQRRSALLIAALPFAMLALLALVDLLSGANAHLTRSVLDAGGLNDLADVAQRRLRLSARSFSRPIVFVFLPLIAALAVLAVARRDRIESWLDGRPAMRAGLIGGVAAAVVGTLANDSGALLLEIGSVYLLAFAGFAWSESEPAGGARAPAGR